jgi:hypothetical protein
MAAVSVVNLTIHKGTYFEETFQLAAEDSSGLNLINNIATAKLRKHPSSPTSHTFSTTLTVADSTVKISMGSTITTALPSGRCYYDVILTTSGGMISKVVEGNVIVEETASV